LCQSITHDCKPTESQCEANANQRNQCKPMQNQCKANATNATNANQCKPMQNQCKPMQPIIGVAN